MAVSDIFLALLGGPTPAQTLTDALIAQADAIILGYTGRDTLPEGLDHTRAMMAVVLYNRMGTEGEEKRVEGEVAVTFEAIPATIRFQLAPYRQARAITLCALPEDG